MALQAIGALLAFSALVERTLGPLLLAALLLGRIVFGSVVLAANQEFVIDIECKGSKLLHCAPVAIVGALSNLSLLMRTDVGSEQALPHWVAGHVPAHIVVPIAFITGLVVPGQIF